MRTEFYEFWSMKRSGMHAIFEWLFYNFIENKERNYIETHSFYCDGFLYINEGEYEIFKEGMRLKPKIVFISYEDVNTQYSILNLKQTKKFIISRNLKNVVASRIKKYNDISYSYRNQFHVNNDFFNTWLEHASSQFNKIYYDKWLIDKAYRDLISLDFKVFNKDKIDFVPDIGGGSSFTGIKLDIPQNLLSRYNEVEISLDVLNKISLYESISLK